MTRIQLNRLSRNRCRIAKRFNVQIGSMIFVVLANSAFSLSTRSDTLPLRPFHDSVFHTIYSRDDAVCGPILVALNENLKVLEAKLKQSPGDWRRAYLFPYFFDELFAMGFSLPEEVAADSVPLEPDADNPMDTPDLSSHTYKIMLKDESSYRLAQVGAFRYQTRPPSNDIMILGKDISQKIIKNPDFLYYRYKDTHPYKNGSGGENPLSIPLRDKLLATEIDTNAGSLIKDPLNVKFKSKLIFLTEWPGFSSLYSTYMNKHSDQEREILASETELPVMGFLPNESGIVKHNLKYYFIYYEYPLVKDLRNTPIRFLLYEPISVGRVDVCYFSNYVRKEESSDE